MGERNSGEYHKFRRLFALALNGFVFAISDPAAEVEVGLFFRSDLAIRGPSLSLRTTARDARSGFVFALSRSGSRTLPV